MSPLEVHASIARTRGIAVSGVMHNAFSCGNWSLGANGFVHWARRVESLGNCSL